MQVHLPIWANFAESYAFLAAAAVVGLAATAAAVTAEHAIATAAAANQQNENDNPPAVIVTHKSYLRKFFQQRTCSFQDIPRHKKCAN